MGIEQICNSIKNVFQTVRPPVSQISRILVVCAMLKRPGLSTIVSASNVIKDLNKLGIPTGPMPNGEPNHTILNVYSIFKEDHRAKRFDMSIQTGITPGSMPIQAGQFLGMNLLTGQGHGIAF